jgi:hypothetical protein
MATIAIAGQGLLYADEYHNSETFGAYMDRMNEKTIIMEV